MNYNPQLDHLEIHLTVRHPGALRSCIRSSDVSRSFGYRRWYAALAEGELAEWLDVGLTGAPDAWP